MTKRLRKRRKVGTSAGEVANLEETCLRSNFRWRGWLRPDRFVKSKAGTSAGEVADPNAQQLTQHLPPERVAANAESVPPLHCNACSMAAATVNFSMCLISDQHGKPDLESILRSAAKMPLQ